VSIEDLLSNFGLNFKSKRDNDGLALEFEVAARPGARQDDLKMENGRLIVATTNLPQRGSANMEITRIIGKRLGLASSLVAIVRGDHSKNKKIHCHYHFSRFKGESYFLDKWKKILLALLMVSRVGAVTSSKDMLAEVEKVKDFSPNEYLVRIEQVQNLYDQYVDFQERVCKREFSNTVFDKMGPIDDEENCLKNLNELQIKYTENTYTARKRYLDYLHTERMKELKRIHDEAISELQKQKD
jgi:uncharacterized protein YggU (UPF0235/DUF167 family)